MSEFYLYIVVSFSILLILQRLLFGELEGRQAKKNSNIRWFIANGGTFSYNKRVSLYVVSGFCYMLTSQAVPFTALWGLELLGFIAASVISDGIGQFLAYKYVSIRFKSGFKEAVALKEEIDKVAKEGTTSTMEASLPTYDINSTINQYLDNEKHVAFMSGDGGKFVSDIKELPPITYVVDGKPNEAREVLDSQNIKITTLTKEGRLPFKDEKIDLVINELTNYDKFELYRVLKPGGYVILNQLGSDNYKEIIRMFIPFKIKGSWDKAACENSLSEIGLDIIDAKENRGYLRFNTLSGLFAFMKSFAPDRVNRYEVYLDFYARALKQIKENKFFDLTTHQFMVVARKKEM